MRAVTKILIALVTCTLFACGDGETSKSASNASLNLKILKWGPLSTPAGELFNTQPNGESAIWFQMSGQVQPNTMEAWFGDKKLDGLSITSDAGGGILVPTELLNKPGKYPVYLIHVPSKGRTELGSFEVLPKPDDVPQIKIQKWGPESTMVGEVFNVQPNGVSALWFQMTGTVYAKTIEAWFGDNKLDGLVIESGKGGGILVPTNLLAKPGRFPVYLIHHPSKTRFDLGVFEVVQKSPR